MSEGKENKNPVKTGEQKGGEQVLVINGEQLSGYNDILVNDLSNYINEKIRMKAKRDGTDILVTVKAGKLSKTDLRLLIKKFLYKNNISNVFKITSPAAKGNSLLLMKLKEA